MPQHQNPTQPAGGGVPEVLAIIREEQVSPVQSTVIRDASTGYDDFDDNVNDYPEEAGETDNATKAENPIVEETCCACVCEPKNDNVKKIDEAEVQRMLEEKEKELTEAFEERLKREIRTLTDRFDYILRNEQTRASYMQSEAYRERQEKVAALQMQLQCKNITAVMYVLCTERRKSKMEKLRIIEDYTNYILHLTNILEESQALILNLSRGYKTAARVDHEWREKMKLVIGEFQNFVYNFTGGTPDSVQYFFDLPQLLKTNAPIVDNPEEDPCDCKEQIEAEPYVEKEWWERLDEDECRPFVMLGDMADFQRPQRRHVLTHLRAAKTAPEKWKEYVFNDMFLKSKCPNADSIKDDFDKRIPVAPKLECALFNMDREKDGGLLKDNDPLSRRVTTTSVDMRGMGSILKIVTQSALSQPVTKATLLGARDSMEIASTTRLREKSRQSVAKEAEKKGDDNIKIEKLAVGSRRTSYYEGAQYYDFDDQFCSPELQTEKKPEQLKEEPSKLAGADESVTTAYTSLGKAHTDSLEIIENHVPDQDHKLHEKLCPMEKCQRKHLNSFLHSLPSYMRAGPFTHFESSYENYETCTPEQLNILKERIDERKRKEKADQAHVENPLQEWISVEGVAVQTSDMSLDLPPCTCRDPNVSPVSSVGQIFKLEDLIPVKQKLDRIKRQCFYDTDIQFDRFKVIGQTSGSSISEQPQPVNPANKPDFTTSRLREIKAILKKHPSLCDLFQANTKC